jgi:hypothetical protein
MVEFRKGGCVVLSPVALQTAARDTRQGWNARMLLKIQKHGISPAGSLATDVAPAAGGQGATVAGQERSVEQRGGEQE